MKIVLGLRFVTAYIASATIRSEAEAIYAVAKRRSNLPILPNDN
jgi:hypothetical protein